MNTYINTKCNALHPQTPYVGVVRAATPQHAAAILYQKNLAYGIQDIPHPDDMELIENGAYVIVGGDSYGFNREVKLVPQMNIETMLEKVQYWVEADLFAQHSLWEKHSQNSHLKTGQKLDFHPSRYSVGFSTGCIANTNIRTSVMVSPFLLNDVLCAFYEATSETVSWRMVEQYLTTHAKNYVGKHCDATNFYSCVGYTEELNKKQ